MRVCVSDAGPLTPEHDAGSRATSDAIETLRSLGHLVTSVPISEVGDLRDFDLFVASRPGPGLHAMNIPGFGDVPSIFFGHDLHFQRMAAVLKPARVEAFRRAEAMCWRSYDLTVYPSSAEAALVNEAMGDLCAVALPIYTMNDEEEISEPESESPSYVFVGSSGHAPNRAAVEVLISDIWPRVRASHPADLHIVGDWSLDSGIARELSVHVHPWLNEANLNTLVSRSWLSLAPLSFGAGVKRKVVHSLHVGTPVVGSRVAFQGIEDDVGNPVGGVVADVPNDFIEATSQLIADADLRRSLGEQGRSWVSDNYSPETCRLGWERAIQYARTRFRSH